MRGRNIVEIIGQQSVNVGARLGVRPICECDLYAKIYGRSHELISCSIVSSCCSDILMNSLPKFNHIHCMYFDELGLSFSSTYIQSMHSPLLRALHWLDRVAGNANWYN